MTGCLQKNFHRTEGAAPTKDEHKVHQSGCVSRNPDSRFIRLHRKRCGGPLRDVPKLIENLNVGVPPPDGSLIEDGDVTVPLTGPAIPHPSEIHIGNILPEGTTRRRTIRFDLPVTR